MSPSRATHTSGLARPQRNGVLADGHEERGPGAYPRACCCSSWSVSGELLAGSATARVLRATLQVASSTSRARCLLPAIAVPPGRLPVLARGVRVVVRPSRAVGTAPHTLRKDPQPPYTLLPHTRSAQHHLHVRQPAHHCAGRRRAPSIRRRLPALHEGQRTRLCSAALKCFERARSSAGVHVHLRAGSEATTEPPPVQGVLDEVWRAAAPPRVPGTCRRSTSSRAGTRARARLTLWTSPRPAIGPRTTQASRTKRSAVRAGGGPPRGGRLHC